MKKVAVVMGSKSDFDVVKPCVKILKEFGVEVSVRVLSAHRTPGEAHTLAANAEKDGFGVIIGVAGKAAHLAGVLAAVTVLPVIALPIPTSMMGGLDSLLSMVQMPSGIPVATVGVGAGENAGLLALQILAVSEPSLNAKLKAYKQKMREKILADDAAVASEAEAL